MYGRVGDSAFPNGWNESLDFFIFVGGKNMKNEGVVRKVDELGRVVIPIHLRRLIEVGMKDPLSIDVNQDYIILKKYLPVCVFCGGTNNVASKLDKYVCKECLTDVNNL